MTSGGQLEKSTAFDEDKTNSLVRSILNRAPEPDAP